MKNENEIVRTENTFAVNVDLGASLSEEMAGLNLTFDRIKVPSGGGLAYEVPSDNPDEPDTKKEIRAVILYHHPVQSYYKEKYSGANDSPDCSSFDGINGLDKNTGETKVCKDCPLNKFGSGENGGKACKIKRRVFLLLENTVIPVIFSIPTTSLNDFSKYILRLVGKGKKSYQVVTKFTLKKEQNSGGITFSKVVASVERELTDTELESILPLTEQVKALAQSMRFTETESGDNE
jgi:hypothetical protein